jgi:tRNA pseudouridine38-40 synthase
MTPRKLRAALNASLPQDVRVLESSKAPPGFDARFSARSKQYRYFVWNHPAMNPLLRGRAWHVPAKLDYPAMKRAARLFVGTRDFRALTVNRGGGLGDAVRTVTLCRVSRSGPRITFVLQGSGFLYKMCRGIVGTLVQLGQGKFREEEVREILAAGDRRAAGMTAPAEGLVLWKVTYAKKPSRADQKRPFRPLSA